MEERRYRFQSAFDAVLAASQPKRKWYQADWDAVCKIEVFYIFCSISSFLLMAAFGALAIHEYDACTVQDPVPQCCRCIKLTKEQLYGQTVPTVPCRNSVYYGVAVIVNVGFGVYYVWQGVRNENKYLLFVVMVTQLLLTGRAVFDILRTDKGEEKENIQLAREIVLIVSAVFTAVSIAVIRPVYNKFGWRIFRRGGAKRQVREIYKWFQRYRALNQLDIQSSVLLFALILSYLSIDVWGGYWGLGTLLACDLLSSRYMVKYLKRECLTGVIISIVAKFYVVGWWFVVLLSYNSCYSRYAESRERSRPWFAWFHAPDLQSVRGTYNGLSCLSERTVHDSRTFVTILAMFAQALAARIGSVVVSIAVCRNFGKGLKAVFYSEAAPHDNENPLVSNQSDEKGLPTSPKEMVDAPK